MKNKKIAYFTVGFALTLAACAPKSNLFVRDSALARGTKKVAVFPFQNANGRASEDTSVQKEMSSLTLKFLAHAQQELSNRYEFISQEKIMAALKEEGFEGFYPNKSMFRQMYVQPTGYTIPEAVAIGKKLGADAIFLGEVAMSQTNPVFSMSVRMLDTKTGKVIVAASTASGVGLSFTPWNAPMKKIVSRISKEVP